jgi:peptidoglycan/LPS O-acetylase OafA/YrhL
MAVPEERGSAPAAARLGYVPALDGVRAVAIALVLLFHYPWPGSTPFHGGYLGVDVFFVLSGFLITTLLLEELDRIQHIALRAFYARRALRLLPAVAVLALFAVFAYFGGVNAAFRPTVVGLVAIVGYVGNWVHLWRSDQLGPMFGHVWSLAIEEQFYLVFPLLLLVAFRARVRRLQFAALLAAFAAISASLRVLEWHSVVPTRAAPARVVGGYKLIAVASSPPSEALQRWNRWYFGSDTHADALLIGCVAATLLIHFKPRITPSLRTLHAAAAATAFVASGAIIASARILSGWVADWGLLALECCVAVVIVGLVVAPAAPLPRILGLAPLRWMGRRSYAIYLFHPVVFLVLAPDRPSTVPKWLHFWFALAIVGLLAELSWRLVERPFLARKQRFTVGAAPRPASRWSMRDATS